MSTLRFTITKNIGHTHTAQTLQNSLQNTPTAIYIDKYMHGKKINANYIQPFVNTLSLSPSPPPTHTHTQAHA